MTKSHNSIPIITTPSADARRKVILAHGGGGALMHRLIDEVLAAALIDAEFDRKHDGALLDNGTARLAFTTDSFVVDPIFFPGGDIGKLAVCGTVNDLAMCGASPVYLSAGFIIEEGFEIDSLRRITESMRAVADSVGMKIVTGDTKVVEHGKGDGVFINTSGIGTISHHLLIEPASIRDRDAVIVNGDIGRHGIAVMSAREGLSFESEIISDVAPLSMPVLKMLEAGVEVHCLRDLTRGGLATALVELAAQSGCGIRLDENVMPVSEGVAAACEILGFDPLYVANEGRFVAIVAEKDAALTLDAIRNAGSKPRVIGTVNSSLDGLVTLRTPLGTERIIEMLSGEQLPRIC